jgi:sulfite exporter TauE/SafE
MLAGMSTQAGIAVSLFVVGLASGVTHCSGMCGPFVLMRLAGREEGGERTTLARLGRAALWRYHLGRAATYSLLGAAAGGAMGFMFDRAGFRWGVAAILIAAIGFMLFAALRGAGLVGTVPLLGNHVPRAVASLAGRASRIGDFPLGMALGLLPCGVVYGALGAAAGTGDAIGGAAAMAAFAAGTFPGLFGVGLGGAFFARRLRSARAAVLPLAVLNVAIATALVLKAVA